MPSPKKEGLLLIAGRPFFARSRQLRYVQCPLSMVHLVSVVDIDPAQQQPEPDFNATRGDRHVSAKPILDGGYWRKGLPSGSTRCSPAQMPGEVRGSSSWLLVSRCAV